MVLKLLFILFFLSAFAVGGFALYKSQINQTSDACMLDKIDLLKTIRYTQKAVFIGGSATLFGINSEYFQEMSGLASVNMSLNAGVPFQLYLETVKPYLKSGDYVFLMPEYDYYSIKPTHINENGINYLCYFDSSPLSSYSYTSWYALGTCYLATGWMDWGYFLQQKIKNSLFPDGFGIYTRDMMNASGDFVLPEGIVSKLYQLGSVCFSDEGFLSYLEKEIVSVQAKGVKVFLIFPPLDSRVYDASEQEIARIKTAVAAQLSCTLVNEPSEASFDSSWFYDTQYHLCHAKQIEFSQSLVKYYFDYQANEKLLQERFQCR
jgi:hypothetical protein